jgi:hypothetical protein
LWKIRRRFGGIGLRANAEAETRLIVLTRWVTYKVNEVTVVVSGAEYSSRFGPMA